MQPQIRLSHRVSTHLLPALLVLAVLILNAPVGNRMHNMHAFLAQLTGERLRELPYRGAARTVRGELRAAPECAEGASEDERLRVNPLVLYSWTGKGITYTLLVPAVSERFLSVISVEPLNTLLRECERAADIRLQTVLKLLACLF